LSLSISNKSLNVEPVDALPPFVTVARKYAAAPLTTDVGATIETSPAVRSGPLMVADEHVIVAGVAGDELITTWAFLDPGVA